MPTEFWLFRNFDLFGIKHVRLRMFWDLEAMALPPSHSQSLPNPGVLILDRIERDVDRFRLIVRVEQRPVCTVCGESSGCRHSSYLPCLQDLPRQGVSVQLWATVGRFRCLNASCPRKIFGLPSCASVFPDLEHFLSDIRNV
jgi:hypothetical protein